MENSAAGDRRLFERIPVELRVKYSDTHSNKQGWVKTKDISANGIGLTATEDLSTPASLEMWVEIPDNGQPLYTTGQVVWSEEVESHKYRAGVLLDKIDLMGMSRVLRAIKY